MTFAQIGFLNGIQICENGGSDEDVGDDKGEDDGDDDKGEDDGDEESGHDDHAVTSEDDVPNDNDIDEVPVEPSSHGKHNAGTSGVNAGAAIGITLAVVTAISLIAAGVRWYYKGCYWPFEFMGNRQMLTGVRKDCAVDNLNDGGTGTYKPVSVNFGDEL